MSLICIADMIIADIFSNQSAESPNWHLFNDFLVRKVPKEDALAFPSSWKQPAVIAYQVSTAKQAVDDSWRANLNTTLLYNNWSIK